MTHCPLCQATLQQTQDKPISKTCPNSHKGQPHLFTFLCYDTGEVHHYQYILDTWDVTFWPTNPNYPIYSDGKWHAVIRNAKRYDDLLYAGKTSHNLADFDNLPQIKKYLKLLSIFS